RAQVLEAGVTVGAVEYLVKRGRLKCVLPGVYRIPGAPRTGRQRAMAATLWLGAESAVSHLTAARLLRFDGCRTKDLHISVPRNVRRRTVDTEFHVHRVLALPHFDRAEVDGIPCTNATRTLIDCAPLLGDEALELAFESARRMRLTSVDALARRAKDL